MYVVVRIHIPGLGTVFENFSPPPAAKLDDSIDYGMTYDNDLLPLTATCY